MHCGRQLVHLPRLQSRRRLPQRPRLRTSPRQQWRLPADLRHYQQDGLNWLMFLREFGLGGVLADDMGLGKTLQTLACIQAEKTAGRLTAPALVVCPTTLIANWEAEAEKFTPGLKRLVIHGQRRKPFFDIVAEADLVITSYPLLHRDLE